MIDEQQDVVREFLVESYENLEQLDRDLVLLEQDHASQPTLSSIFRTIHTIKGTCGFLGFGKLESVAHVGENLLSKLRDGDLRLRPDMTTALLSLVDAIREILGNIESVGAEGEADYTDLIKTLILFLEDASDNSTLAIPVTSDAALQTAMRTRSAEEEAGSHDGHVLLLAKQPRPLGDSILANPAQSTARFESMSVCLTG